MIDANAALSITSMIWTINAFVFFLLFVIWNKTDLINVLCKLVFGVLAVVNAAPAWIFLLKVFKSI